MVFDTHPGDVGLPDSFATTLDMLFRYLRYFSAFSCHHRSLHVLQRICSSIFTIPSYNYSGTIHLWSVTSVLFWFVNLTSGRMSPDQSNAIM